MSSEYDNAIYEGLNCNTKKTEENSYEVPNQEKILSRQPCSKNSKNSKNFCVIAQTVVVVVLVLGVVATCIGFAVEIVQLKTEVASQGQKLSDRLDNATINREMLSLNNTLALQQAINSILERLENNVTLHQQSIDSLSERLDNFTLTSAVRQRAFDSLLERLDNFTVYVSEDYTSRMQQLASSSNTSLQQLSERIGIIEYGIRDLNQRYPVSSCSALPLSSPSGYYWVRASNGSVVHVYCDMTRSCGGVTGGWMRVAKLDMTNSSHQCPSGFRQQTVNNLRTCVRALLSPGCSSDIYSIASINYESVCGRIIAYQYGSTDAFLGRPIDSIYVDGVSLTHGSPRQHIWTFASALHELDSSFTDSFSSCPCIQINITNARIPSFVGDDYFCDTGSQDRQQRMWYTNDPLWDGAGCGNTSTCCSFNHPPWFYKQLPQPTTDDIEMRLCRDEDNRNDDVAIEMIDIFVQ